MPRANRYFLPGSIYHLTHRCHDRQFLFKFAQDRNRYRQILWESLKQFEVEVFCYCLTSNHTHFLVRSEVPVAVSRWMQEVQSRFAQAYNRRKQRSGAFWEGRYHCTMVEPGPHLWNCMRYIELNMVRAGVVSHPDQWAWCSYQEWFGLRQRYCLIDQQSCLRVLGTGELSVFQGHFRRLIDETIEEDKCHREPQWTESIAVGSETFITKVREATEGRQRFTTERFAVDAWVLKELPPGPDLLRSKNRAKNRV